MKLSVSWKPTSTTKPALLPWDQTPRSNVGQVAHVSPTPWVTSQKANITLRTPEAACWLRLRCWSNTIANSHPSLGAINCRVLRSCLVPQCSYPPNWPRHQLRLPNCHWMPAASYTTKQHPILASIQPAELRPRGATLSLGRPTMESGHLHSALTHPSSADSWRLKSRHPFVPAAQQLINFSVNNSIRETQWADHQWNAKWADNPTRLRILIPDTGTHPPGMTSLEEPGSGSTASAPVSDVSAPACTNEVWPPLQPVSVAQKNKPSTMLSSNVQPIDLSMDCTAWRFRTIRQPNGCSTPGTKSSAAKQWIKELVQNEKKLFLFGGHASPGGRQ